MHQELVVIVLIEALQAAAIAAHAVHARCRVAGKFDPFRIRRVKLWMDYGSRKWNDVPLAAIRFAHCQSADRSLFNGHHQPFSAGGQRRFSNLRASEFHDQPFFQRVSVQFPKPRSTDEKDGGASRTDGWRESMNCRTERELPDLSSRKRIDFIKLKCSASIGDENHHFAAWCK